MDSEGSRLRGQVVEAQFDRVRNALLVPGKNRGGLSSLYMANNWPEYYQAMSWDIVEAIKCFAKSDDTSKSFYLVSIKIYLLSGLTRFFF